VAARPLVDHQKRAASRVDPLRKINSAQRAHDERANLVCLEPHLLLEALTFMADLHDNRSIVELFAVRRILEPAAVALASGRIQADEIDELRRIVESVDATMNMEDLIAHDVEFHQALAAASGNSYLSTLTESLSGPTIRARVWKGTTPGDAVGRTLAEHRAMINALALGDAELAAALTTVHISGIEQWLERWTAALETSGDPL
jgi:GntR family transcriptional repressor for pyruvate dehydrogenase complex